MSGTGNQCAIKRCMRRQAHRYLREAQALKRPVAISARSVAITVKVPEDVAAKLRAHAHAHAHATGSTIGDVLSRDVLALLAREHRRG